MSEYEIIRKNYENLPKNDKRAIPYVKTYIQKSKNENDFEHLTQGYRDAVFFTKNEKQKLVYSDSMIYAALKSRDKDLIGLAYLGKGIIYYFNYKKFDPALDEYLKAYNYLKNTKDEYLKYKVVYHMGVVKSYLGYYSESKENFEECIKFFNNESVKQLHPNEVFNNKRGYFNSLHQLIICQRNLKNFAAADSLINVGLKEIEGIDEFSLEKSYFLKCKGISAYNRQNYKHAIDILNKSLPKILKVDDFATASLIYSYLGKSYYHSDKEKALHYFEMVDSIFVHKNFVLPETRDSYEILINHFNNLNNTKKELYYTKQLLSVDSLLGKEFYYLTSRIHKEYDTKRLLDNKEALEKRNLLTSLMVIFFICLSLLFITLYIFKYRKNKKIMLNYRILQIKLDNRQLEKMLHQHSPDTIYEDEKTSIISKEIYQDLLLKIKSFEDRQEYTQIGLTLNQLAAQFNTNTTYLSTFINESKGVNFKNYLNNLRIDYITNLMNTDKNYLKYTIEALAEKCGIASRQNFSDLFYEINGMRPTDFIKKKKEEQKNNNGK
ncbi:MULTISPECIES: helix-turn-helix domain-containing protein [Chryseobacterium group]|uniref:Helix-turn-helix domain-containing protein n=4 Tax=Chryseobacterium TaxID=59732 RepID=A0AAJ1R4V9_9FLAO|nr:MULTISPECIES: helix-turn-helix domain-containing protein [Chryseobacterium group]MDN4013292.1 helix-turn-helix domain-containing protein [Chryseobacterium gambrini]MDN4028854.1 helix-turn-helix domain-containing protein [Chryseobacterium gambrini]MDO3425148.1 helix-turn-helix domain-containing protein [Chryseobacterium sp. APV1]QQY34009.1 helix-turn-helix domain-containing protein [Chryseobacterium gleum]QWA40130.1 helix-turn-helix domain-containing protein [Chryseobacterium sp. ZHDP1]